MGIREDLIARLSDQPEPPLVRIEEFLAGNDDLGSIGCNLMEHPGLDAFRAVFGRLAARTDVDAIYAQIAELDPGDGCWPFADTVLVVGAIDRDQLAREVASLQPDEVSLQTPDEVAPGLPHHGKPVHVVWWD